jgi:hypothetical protein
MNATKRTIVVPTGGLSERFVFGELGLTFDQVQPLYGDAIGSPRDYIYFGSGTIFTAEGVRRLAAHFGIDVEVTDHVSFVAATAQPNQEHKHLPWWQRDLEDAP